jgi:hypothetical protein
MGGFRLSLSDGGKVDGWFDLVARAEIDHTSFISRVQTHTATVSSVWFWDTALPYESFPFFVLPAML